MSLKDFLVRQNTPMPGGYAGSQIGMIGKLGAPTPAAKPTTVRESLQRNIEANERRAEQYKDNARQAARLLNDLPSHLLDLSPAEFQAALLDGVEPW